MRMHRSVWAAVAAAGIACGALAQPAETAAPRPVGLAGSAYGVHEVKALVKDVMTPPEGKRYAHESLGEALPVEALGKYSLVIVASATAKPLTAEESEALRAYVEGGGHLLFIQSAPKSLAADLGLPKMDWLGMKSVNWHRNGLPCKVLKPDHPFLKGALEKTAEPKWLNAATAAKLSGDAVENLAGTEAGDCLIGYRALGKGWFAYLGHEYFRLIAKTSTAIEDAPSWRQVVRNIVAAAEPAVVAADR